ncbi:IS21 family transposase, partial [Paraburkholderia atlantica]|uniref:IS21 family transposase n=1 Tax=Paraburkholderia atlantica TaxID=2654982 RepID=UPI0038BAD2BB
MRMIKDVLRLKFDGGFSHDRIAASLGISKGVVTKYVGLAGAAGLDWASACDMDEGELERRLLGKPTGPAAYAQPDYGRIHQELRRKGVTLTLLWEEYQAEFADRQTYRYTQFCEHYKAFTKRLKRSMRQIHRAGEKLFVDFAGPTLPLTTGRRAHIFVAAMGASSYTFACATPAETMEDWLGGIARALSFYGGVPQLIVPDNPRAMIADPDRYEPRAGDTVLDFARHYGTSFLPARVYRPRDKPKVEVAVQVVERWIMARLRHHRFASVQSVDDAIRPLLKNLNERPFQKLPGCRASAFAELDAPALQPLPAQPYELARFKTVTVHILCGEAISVALAPMSCFRRRSSQSEGHRSRSQFEEQYYLSAFLAEGGLLMFDQLFKDPAAVARHTTAPLYRERVRYLEYMQRHRASRKTLIRNATYMM